MGLGQTRIQKDGRAGLGGFEAPSPRGRTRRGQRRDVEGVDGVGNGVRHLQSITGSPGSVVSELPNGVLGGAAAADGFLCVSKFPSVTECLSLRCLS